VERQTQVAAPEAVEENIAAIKIWERAALDRRSRAEQIGEAITRVAGSGTFLIAHVIWFGAWLAVNLGLVPGVERFDKFPFPLLTTVVSLEAIFLSLFVLASQNRMTHQSDQRSHLDLQVDMLAEREMTAVLVLLQDIARHMDVKVSLTSDYIRDLAKKTDIHKLTARLNELPKE
jgi:uncharacterized membrane protein